MLDGIRSLFAIVFVFGMVIFVHELGHFLAAKLVGVYAPRFSIGFGRALWRRRRGETEYVLGLLPLGGYVRMASREDQETAFLEGASESDAAREARARGDWDEEAMIPFGPRPVPEHRWFESKPLHQRLMILLAGVTMNVVLALAVNIGLQLWYGRTVLPTRVVGYVRAIPAAPALASSIAIGDTIVTVGGEPVENWNDVQRRLITTTGPHVRVETQRGTVDVPVPTDEAREALLRAVDPYIPPVIDSVGAGRPAERAGLRGGDSVVAVDGRPVRSWSELVALVTDRAGDSLGLDVVRAGTPLALRVGVDSITERDPQTGRDRVRGQIGILPRDVTTHEEIHALAAVRGGWARTWEQAGVVLDVLRGLFARRVSVNQLGGPIAIARLSASAARSGLETLLALLAFLSINIAVFNLLPIPILDGGQIVLNVIESVRGRPLGPRAREYILRFGLALIALLFVVVMFNDISRFVQDILLRRS